MAGHKEKAQDPRAAVIKLRQELARKIAQHAQLSGETPTLISGLSLYRRTEPTACFRATYEPSITVFVQGRKRINLTATSISATHRPFSCRQSMFLPKVKSSKHRNSCPFSLLFLRLDMPMVREVISRDELPEPQRSVQSHGIAVGETTVGLLAACHRLIELLDTPDDIPFLGHLIQHEIVYRILRTPQGERLRAIATTGDLSHRTARAISWLSANYTKPLHMEELAAVARMGVSTLHHQFRALTAMSPLQYQKQLRLQNARQRMLMDGFDATSAAYAVGYESVSQFTREYRRFFGQPPLRDVKSLRDRNVSVINVASE